MGRIDTIFAGLREGTTGGLMPFICGGHPRPDSVGELLHACAAGGASVVEVGIPFSDPIADGPVIASAMHRALAGGATPEGIFEQVRRARDSLSIGIIAMVSVSIVHGWGGARRFCERARDAGFDGLIVPDLTLGESGPVREAAATCGLSLSLLISPSTPAQRVGEIARASTGFVYLMARLGITGERQDVPEIAGKVTQIRAASSIPIACGFGISTPEQVRQVVRQADAAIVGSALVRRLDQSEDPGGTALAFVRELAQGLDVRGDG